MSLFCFALLISYVSNFVNATEYPLYAIVTGYYNGKKTSFTEQDIQIIATNFTRAQISVNSSAAELFHKYNQNFQLEHYTYTWIMSNSTFAEANKQTIAIYPFATLSQPLTQNSNDNIINYKLNNNFHSIGIPITASTTTNNYSISCKEFVSYIKINNEYMKVLSIKNNSQIVVQRGFIGINNGKASNITSHNTNSTIFAPVYTGDSPLMASCSNIRYAINAESQYAIDSLVNATIYSVNNGYNGSWFDCFSSNIFQPFTLNGQQLSITKIWDSNKNKYYNCTSYRITEQNRLTGVWNGLKQRGYNIDGHDKIIITANDMYEYGYFQCGTNELLIKNSIAGFEHPLDGYSIESYALKDVGPCNNSTVELLTNVNGWMNNVKELMNASQSGLNVMPMIGDAGCHSYALEKLNNSYYDQLINFGYASFLLAIESKNGNSKFGIPAMKINTEKNIRYAHVSETFFWNIGNPIQTYSYLDLDKYIIPGHFSYMRYFENGLILVNPYYNRTDMNINLNQTYYNPDKNSAKMKDNIVIPPYSAFILLNDPSHASKF
eukprot:303684_1